MNKYAEILIVDDMPEHITFAGEILKSAGYKVYAATSGKAALKFLKKKKPDLMVLDINMAEMSGFEVCRMVKENPETKDIPIIFLTAEHSSAKIKEGFRMGCCDYVEKPFLKEEYLARVQTHLNISRQNRELTTAYNELNLFCSAVSHDLKSPLNVINMLIDTLKDEIKDELNEESAKILELISGKSQQLVKMIERLLDFSRMCNIQPHMMPLDFKRLLEEQFNELKNLEPNRQIKLMCTTLPSIYGDEVLVKLVLKNILSNAFKFTKYKPEAIITVDSYNEGEYHIIEIVDNGAGFDPKYADKLFSIFQRLHEQEVFEGSGVGLAMVDRIMKRHGGKVSITGAVDEGAKVSLYFLKAFNS